MTYVRRVTIKCRECGEVSIIEHSVLSKDDPTDADRLKCQAYHAPGLYYSDTDVKIIKEETERDKRDFIGAHIRRKYANR